MSFWKVFWAVVLGNIVSWFVVSIIGWIVWALFLGALVNGLSDRLQSQRSLVSPPSQVVQSRSSRSVTPVLPAPQPVQKRERVFSDSAIEQNRRMCDFWTKQYRKDHDPESLGYRDAACSRYRHSVTAYK
ncbi:hypothetical protein [Marinobacter salexigens]|uniref:hypothetical protein n=1 Tax=Marinobacter salexigens TaxID=1925763 RepID=UPI00128FD9B3|nr:hypothetical protein [Marinobacter salexigens]